MEGVSKIAVGTLAFLIVVGAIFGIVEYYRVGPQVAANGGSGGGSVATGGNTGGIQYVQQRQGWGAKNPTDIPCADKQKGQPFQLGGKFYICP